jgi:hypothetical protein
MKKVVSKKLRLSTIKVATLSQSAQQEVKGGAASLLCTKFLSCGPETCFC